MNSQLEDFANSIVSAKTSQDAWTISTALFESFGFVGSMYGVRELERTPRVGNMRFSDGLAEWEASYKANKDYQRDPLLIYAPKLPNIFFTGVAFLDDHPYLEE